MNVAQYMRYSSDKQNEMSIAAQCRACDDYCAKKGYAVVKQYVDEAESARTDNRPAFQQMIADAKAGLFDVLVVHKIDRFARDRYDDAFYKRVLKKAGVSVEFVEQNIDGSPESIILESVLVGMAEYYSKNLAKETLKGLNERAYNAKFNGGTPPYGYNIVDGKYVVNEIEANGIRLIFTMYLEGHGYAQISDELYNRGYKTKRGGRFSKTSLHDILLNPRYIGTYIFGKVKKNSSGQRNSHSTSEKMITVPNAIPAIISNELWSSIQDKLKNNKNRPGAFSAKRLYVLSGLIKCGCCGANYVGSTVTPRQGVEYSYYSCGARERKSGACPSKMVSREALEDKVLKVIECTLFSPEGKSQTIAEINDAYARVKKDTSEELAQLESEYKKVTNKISNLLDMMEEGLGNETIKERLRQHTGHQAILGSRIKEIKQKAQKLSLTPEQVDAIIEDYYSTIREKTPDGLRSLFNTFVEKVIVTNESLKAILKLSVRTCMVPRTGIEPVRMFPSDGF